MTDPIAVQGTISKYRTTADGCLRIEIELNELETAKFHESFAHGAYVVVARLTDPDEQPAA